MRRVVVVSAPMPVSVGGEQLELQPQVAPSLAHQPRPPPQSPVVVAHHRVGQVDREQRVVRCSRQGRGRGTVTDLRTEAATTMPRVARLLVGDEGPRPAGEQLLQATEDPPNAIVAAIPTAPEPGLVTLQPAATKAALPRHPANGRHVRGDHELAAAIDEHRDRQRRDAAVLEALELVEHEVAVGGQSRQQVAVEQPHVASDLAELLLHRVRVEAEDTAGLTQADAAGQQ